MNKIKLILIQNDFISFKLKNNFTTIRLSTNRHLACTDKRVDLFTRAEHAPYSSMSDPHFSMRQFLTRLTQQTVTVISYQSVCPFHRCFKKRRRNKMQRVHPNNMRRDEVQARLGFDSFHCILRIFLVFQNNFSNSIITWKNYILRAKFTY